jgi:uncharacterized protein (DUF362 family)
MQRLPRSDAKFQISKPQPGITERTTAGATRSGTPLVGIVSSAFAGSEEHDGTKVEGLSSPRPIDAELTREEWQELVRKAMELGGPIERGFESLVGGDEWVLLLVDLDASAVGEKGRPAVSDPRVVEGVVSYLLEKGRGARITIAGAPPPGTDSERLWANEWGGAFGGLSYQKMVDQLSAMYPKVRLELVDLNRTETIAMHVRGEPLAGGLSDGLIATPRPFQQCDSIICVAPLKAQAEMGAGLGLGCYLNAAAQGTYGPGWSQVRDLGSFAALVVDLYTIRPAEIIVLGGGWGVEGDGNVLRHNVVAAGTRVVPVDAVGASIMEFKPEEMEQLHLAGKKGYNSDELDGITDYIWIRGNEIDQVKRAYSKPPGWKPYSPGS